MKKKVLIIDDEAKFTQMVKFNLESEGRYEVGEENDPTRALECARKFKPDLILLDIMMPKKDGFEVLESLKDNAELAAIPVIMLTAIETDQAKIKSAQLKDEDYIVKPVTADVLEKKIAAVLAKAES